MIDLDNLSHDLKVPEDFENPDWGRFEKIHCWRNHVPQEFIDNWNLLSLPEKKRIAQFAFSLAQAEEWD